MKHIIGIDIGGTKCAVSLGSVDDAAGTCDILKKAEFGTVEQGGRPSVIAKLLRTAGAFIRESRDSGNRIDAIGVSCGGPLDSRTGTILSPPNLPDWDSVPIKTIIYKEFNIPVKVQNDANACALAEWRYGAAKGYSDVIFLTFGTGMGAGLILDGRLYSGANDMAGERRPGRLRQSGVVRRILQRRGHPEAGAVPLSGAARFRREHSEGPCGAGGRRRRSGEAGLR
jgi:glucokinase